MIMMMTMMIVLKRFNRSSHNRDVVFGRLFVLVDLVEWYLRTTFSLR